MASVGGLLFVCTANRARSPLAQLVARRLLDQVPGGGDVAVSSAGTWTPGGEAMWPPAAAEVRRLGLDPDGFVSRPISDAVVADADVVLAATRALRDEVVTRWPRLIRRCFTWRELAWLIEAVPPEWDSDDLGSRVAALPVVAARNRGRVPAPRGADLDVEDPAGRRPEVMRATSDLTVTALGSLVAAVAHRRL